MSKFYFVKEMDKGNRFDCSNVMVEVLRDATLPELLAEFKGFLLACGFQIDGELDVVYEEHSSRIHDDSSDNLMMEGAFDDPINDPIVTQLGLTGVSSADTTNHHTGSTFSSFLEEEEVEDLVARED